MLILNDGYVRRKTLRSERLQWVERVEYLGVKEDCEVNIPVEAGI